MSDEDEVLAVYESLLARTGEAAPAPRLTAARRVAELLGDPQRTYPTIHIAGTNGKTSTSRLVESLLRAHGLRTGLFTSPHLERFTERIQIDGEPISDEAIVENWRDVSPFLDLVDEELTRAGEVPVTYFEALTVLAFACFADAPVDVAVIEVGMGGEWDSTNIADGDVAVLTPISLDHTDRLGTTIAEIARTKSGIVKPAQTVVSARQVDEAMTELRRAADLSESRLLVEGDDFAVESDAVAVGGQLVGVRGLAARYDDVFLPLLGGHQAQNAAVAVAAVEAFLGGGDRAIAPDVLEQAFGQVVSPGRLQLIGTDPTVLIDAAHNPAGAAILAEAVRAYFDFDEIRVVLGVVHGKDLDGIVDALAPVASGWLATRSSSERSVDEHDVADAVERRTGGRATVADDLEDAVESAREWAAESPRRAVLVTGSIALIGEVLSLARRNGWRLG